MLKKWIFRFFVVVLMSASGSSYGQTMVMRHYDTSAIRAACRSLVMRHADRGYPFASVVADSAVVSGRRVNVYCTTTLSQLYHIENVYIIGGAGVSPYYIYSVTGLAPGAVYSESRVGMAARRVAAGGAAAVRQDAEVEFHPGSKNVAQILWVLASHSIATIMTANISLPAMPWLICATILDTARGFGLSGTVMTVGRKCLICRCVGHTPSICP